MSNILVPFDGSKHSLKALHIACDLATKHKVKLSLLYVITGASQADLPLEKNSPLLIKALEVMKLARDKSNHWGAEFNVLEFEYGPAAEGILLAARKCGASTIVMGCRGLKPEDTDVFGTVSQAVFQQADCTCISVK